MKSDRSQQHVVRLPVRARDHAPTVLAAFSPQKKRTRPDEFMITHALVHPRNVAPARKVEAAPIHEREQVYGLPLGLTLASGFFGKAATLFLVPMLLIYPLIPAYAATGDVADASTTTSADTTTSAGASTDTTAPASTPSDSAPSDPLSYVAADAPPPTPPPAPPDTSSQTPSDGNTTNDPSSVSGSSDQTTATTTDNPPEQDASTTIEAPVVSPQPPPTPPPAPPAGGSDASAQTGSTTPVEEGTGTSTASSTISGPDLSATTTPQFATSTESIATTTAPESSTTPSTAEGEGAASSTSAAEGTEPPPPPKPIVETPEQIADRLVQGKEDLMRNELRQEVETEFTKGCLTLDGVGYYCLKNTEGLEGTIPTSPTTVSNVVSQLDRSSGYKEIFITKGDVTTQLTHDSWDDTFPATDVSGRSIVWQGNVSGRWQIFFADASTSSSPTAIQVTHASESNFNPRVDGDGIVWQGWVDGNWEIYYAERVNPDPVGAAGSLPAENVRLGIDNTWHVVRITNNSVHDMFPSIAGGLVTWQSFQDNAWNVYAYNIKTGVTTKLSQGGVKSENPHFAITWDERTPEGAARMVGYDIATGKTIDYTNEARQVNDDNLPYHPDAPISQQNQAALPAATSTATSTTSRSDDTSGSGNGPPGV